MADRVIVTGGAGFIGCNFVRCLLKQKQAHVTIIDKLTYSGSLHHLDEVLESGHCEFIKADIADGLTMREIFHSRKPKWAVNFAAETHVDRSIDAPADFLHTNVNGVFSLLEASLSYYQSLDSSAQEAFRFLHVSTDEVYGSLGKNGLFSETTPYAPNSPYAASKAASDHFVRAYFSTYGLPILITNCSNNYGPYQFPEKLIPLMILNALEAKPLPIYGDGKNVRDWLHVEDHCEGIACVLAKGKPGESYNIGGKQEKTNIEIVDKLCELLEKLKPAAENPSLKSQNLRHYADLKTFVADRPGHDRRYAIDASKIKTQLGWQPSRSFEQGLETTVQWYLKNLPWCEKVQKDNYQRERLGTGRSH